MESFFLSETCKYLYLVFIFLFFSIFIKLFDVDNPLNWHYEKLLFSTEGHTFPIVQSLRRYPIGKAYHDETGNDIALTWTMKGSQNLGNGLFNN